MQTDVADIKGILNSGLQAVLQDLWSELAIVNEDIQLIRDALTGHVTKADVVYKIFKRVMRNVEPLPSENDKGVRSVRRSQATSKSCSISTTTPASARSRWL